MTDQNQWRAVAQEVGRPPWKPVQRDILGGIEVPNGPVDSPGPRTSIPNGGDAVSGKAANSPASTR